MFLLWKDFSCNLGNLRLPKKTVIVISAECIYKFVTNLMVFIKGLLIQLFLSFDAEKLMNQLFNPNFFTLPFSPFFVIDCVTFIRVFGSIWGEIGYLAFVKMCLVFSYFFLLPSAAKPDEWGDFSYFSDIDNGILLPKLFWPTVRKICSRDWEKLLRSLEQFIQTVKGQNNFW